MVGYVEQDHGLRMVSLGNVEGGKWMARRFLSSSGVLKLEYHTYIPTHN